MMKHAKIQFALLIVVATILAGSFPLTVFATARSYPQEPITKALVRKPATQHEKMLLKAFNRSLKQYLQLREQVRKRLPPLSKDSTPEQITAYQKQFVDALRAARAYAKPGYMFSPAVANYIRTTIKTEFKGSDRAEIRETILDADTKGVPLRVNYPYPETKELTQIPPTLLLKLPELPKEVKYRFVGRNLLLVDTDNGLIVDYMLNALP